MQGKRERVVVAMSGGVDSSVAAALLLERGYDVIGITMKTYSFDKDGGNVGNETSCCGLDAFNDARMVAVSLGIPHYVVDFTHEFEEHVVQNFVDEYMKGRTPNPCVICNRAIKWGELLRKAASLGADKIATGHYARVRYDESRGRYVVAGARDSNKDQTYALWGLSQDAFSRTLFPLGELTKPEVRDLARRHGLKTAEKQESFEICFIADNDYHRFLQERLGADAQRLAGGDIVRDGRVVGRHSGYPNYTIGQRNGIGAHGERVYVTGIDPAANRVTIGTSSALLHASLIADQINPVSIPAFTDGMRVAGKVRYKDEASPATVYAEGEDRLRVVFDQPKRAITAGQSVVLYDGEELLGGGIIRQAVPAEIQRGNLERLPLGG